MADPVVVGFPFQDADCLIETLADGRIAVTLRSGMEVKIALGIEPVDAMRWGHELRTAATHAMHLRRTTAEEGAKG